VRWREGREIKQTGGLGKIVKPIKLGILLTCLRRRAALLTCLRGED